MDLQRKPNFYRFVRPDTRIAGTPPSNMLSGKLMEKLTLAELIMVRDSAFGNDY
jgi:hypothetical protein